MFTCPIVLKLIYVVHNGDCYGAPRALLILEAQALLARFLRDFATSMVANMDTLTTEQTVQKLYIPDGSMTKFSKPEQQPWMQFGMTYYSVRTTLTSPFPTAQKDKVPLFLAPFRYGFRHDDEGLIY